MTTVTWQAQVKEAFEQATDEGWSEYDIVQAAKDIAREVTDGRTQRAAEAIFGKEPA